MGITVSFHHTVHNCDDIRTIEACFLAILIVGGFAAVFTLAGSIIGCMGTCCARSSQVTMVTKVYFSLRFLSAQSNRALGSRMTAS